MRAERNALQSPAQVSSRQNETDATFPATTEHGDRPVVAYIMKGFPRRSEAFISNEVYLLESMGLRLHIFSVFRPDEQKQHANVDRIKAGISYLPEASFTADSGFPAWLWHNLPRYFASHARLVRRRPLVYAQTWLEALWLSFHCRSKSLPIPKKNVYKEFLRAGYIAEQVLESRAVQHLHAHFCHGSTTVAMLASRLTGIPFSFTAHAKDIYLPKLNPRDLLQIKLRRAEFVATCTDANRQHLLKVCPDAPVHTIYHGVDTSLFTPSDVGAGEVPLILSVGRFVAKKGFPYLVQACRLLVDRGHHFHCRIIGTPDEETPKVQRLVQDLELEGVVTLGDGVIQDELRHIYAHSAIFALPCHIVDNGDRDGIPNVLAEAMAMGKPVVASAVSGIPELITQDENGLLIPQKDAEALADALEKLLMSPDLRERLGRSARATICRIFDSRQTTVALMRQFTPRLAPRDLQPCSRESLG